VVRSGGGTPARWSGSRHPIQPDLPADLRVAVEDRNPWTHLRLNNDPAEFQFAIVSDRTGGNRPGVFRQAVEVLNLLQPQFVLSVGDLVDGYTEDRSVIDRQWREFEGEVNRLQMPFFYVPGNHDLSNSLLSQVWRERRGRRYYDFVYRDVLFLVLNSDDTADGVGRIGPEQCAFVRRSLEENRSARWTVVCLHRPLWTERDVAKTGWLEIEKELADRRYTVFAGHEHSFQKYVRQGRDYYQLATTGGGSDLRGVAHGEIDQIAWVTMKKDGPIIANVLLDGVYRNDLKKPGDGTAQSASRGPQ
jgi:serine/threonine-protein phosphatase CPPED1